MLVLIIVILFIHVSHAPPPETHGEPSSIQEAIETINPELNRITKRIKLLKVDVSKISLKLHAETHAKISRSSASILNAINELETNFNQVSWGSNPENLGSKNKCTDIHLEKLERILNAAHANIQRDSESLQLLLGEFNSKAEKLVKDANDIEKNMNKIIGFCVRQYNLAWMKDRLNDCFRNEAAILSKLVDGFNENLNKTREEMLCTRESLEHYNIIQELKNLQIHFLKCVIYESESFSGATSLTPAQNRSRFDLEISIDDDSSLSSGISQVEKNSANFSSQQETVSANSYQGTVVADRLPFLQHLLNQLKLIRMREHLEEN